MGAEIKNIEPYSTAHVLIEEFKQIHSGNILAIASEQCKDNLDNEQIIEHYYNAVHNLVKSNESPGQTALCLSGGGIRSAAFNLGVMQGLAHLKLLSQFDYLSTVSGGGYIGSWLSAWIYNERKKDIDRNGSKVDIIQIIQDQLAKNAPDGKTRLISEPTALVELRKNIAFLTPKVGLDSADTWAALIIVLRNMILNWLVFIPLIISILLIPKVIKWLLFSWANSNDNGKGTFFIDTTTFIFNKIFESHQGPINFPINNWYTFHYWLDTAGVTFVLIGLSYTMYQRSKPVASIDNHSFKYRIMLPLVTGFFLIVMQSVYFVPNGEEPNIEQLKQWIAYGSLTYLISFIPALISSTFRISISPSIDKKIKRITNIHFEFIAQIVTGAVVGAFIWLFLFLRHHNTLGNLEFTADYDATFGVPGFLISFLIGNIVTTALTSRIYPRAGDRHREWWARANGYYAAISIIWIALFWLVLFGWDTVKEFQSHMLAIALGSGSISLLGASPLSSALGESLKVVKITAKRLTTIASVLFILCMVIWIAHYSSLIPVDLLNRIDPDILNMGPDGLLSSESYLLRLVFSILGLIILFLMSLISSLFVNVNHFSLNAMYRNRLVRSFLGASNVEAVDRNKFNGFAESDNINMHKLRNNGNTKLFHVINITLNLTGTENKAWQERKSASFICSPLYTGGDIVGYRSSELYSNGITIGTAMSLSGAAVSPNWGYHSSTPTSFVMMLFNARLGGWFGNPKNYDSSMKIGPDTSYQRFIQEALGYTSEDQPFVYLSDGGHFENLALYEMVRRRCHIIVVCDCGADPECTLEDLGNAIRKIYIDLGVEISFDNINFRAREIGIMKPGYYAAVGSIRYPEQNAKEGKIIYIKPGLYEDAPVDVKAFAATNQQFPHDTTLNQWFTESQFESYRALGEHAIKMMSGQIDNMGSSSNEQSLQSKEIKNLVDFCAKVSCYVDPKRKTNVINE